VHLHFYKTVFSNWDHSLGPPPAWIPSPTETKETNLAAFLRLTGKNSVAELHDWSVANRAEFWETVAECLNIRFQRPPRATADLAGGIESPQWFPGASLNIVESCFSTSPDATAIIFQTEGGYPSSITYGALDELSNRVAYSLSGLGLCPGDTVAIVMPMTVEAVAAYLGVVKAGCAVVSVADSFAPDEIRTRLRIAGTEVVFTQDVVIREERALPLYQKVVDAGAARAVVVPAAGSSGLAVSLRAEDVGWESFLAGGGTASVRACDPGDTINVLFSSGTTGEPKAIPWTHTTPVKCAMDGYLHHDIKPGDVVAWPTNLGWMMGPWLIFATLISGGVMALYYGTPVAREFCEFVQNAKVRMLGVVPSMVKAWRSSGAADGLDWTSIKTFSSTGEASNPEDMLYLMSRAGYRPVIEYCGGTEIGGGYVTGTLVQAAAPATFTTAAFGLGLYILDENGLPAKTGETFLVPPSIGLSDSLINKNHHNVYYEGTPACPGGELLRRHGDQMERLPGGFYRALGRADDAMNLGGIKTSAAEIERIVSSVAGVSETAAIAASPDQGGPGRLIIFAVLEPGVQLGAAELLGPMQREIKKRLNPLFKIHDVVLIDALPRTASNKVMRRELRSKYSDQTD
jgi:acetyl-CoA synthetase